MGSSPPPDESLCAPPLPFKLEPDGLLKLLKSLPLDKPKKPPADEVGKPKEFAASPVPDVLVANAAKLSPVSLKMEAAVSSFAASVAIGSWAKENVDVAVEVAKIERPSLESFFSKILK